MNYKTSITIVMFFMFAGCTPNVMLPPVQEPIDSKAWDSCASESAEKESMSMAADLNKDGKTLLCQGVVKSRNPADIDEAVEMLNEAAVLDKAEHRAYYLIGRILVGANRFEEALTAFANSAKRYPSMEVPSERLGRAILEKDGLEEAMNFSKKALKRGLCNYGCKGFLASLYTKQEKFDEAVAIYEEMIEEDKNEPAAFVGLASVYNNSGDFSKEAKTLANATSASEFKKLSPKHQAKIHFSQAFAHYTAKELVLAKSALEKALYLEDKPMWIVLSGWIAAKQGDPAMALVKFEKVIARDDKISAAHLGKAEALEELNRDKDAKKSYEKAIELDKSNLIAVLKLARVNANLGNIETASELMAQLESSNSKHLPEDLVKEVADAISAAKN